MERLAIRSGKGFGDSLYLQGVARHFVSQGVALEVCSHFPDIFRPLAGKVDVSPFRRERIDIVAHYIERKYTAGTDQFTDCCIRAGIEERVAFHLRWVPSNAALMSEIRRTGRPVIVVALPRAPMGRLDGYGDALLPDCRVIQRAIDRLREHAQIVQIGKGEPRHAFEHIDLDLAQRTSVAEAIDAVFAADGVLGYCSYLAPLAESLGKPGLFVWSRRGLKSGNRFIRAITPEKIFNRPATSRSVVDDCSDDELRSAVDALCQQIGVRELV